MATAETRKRILVYADYLLGVYDEHRMGSLRLKADDNDSPFVNNDSNFMIPP